MSNAATATTSAGEIIALSSLEERALDLLVAGVPQAQVASALGVTESNISQLLSQDSFKKILVERKYDSLIKHNARDLAYDKLEDLLLEKLAAVVPFLIKPMEISRILTQINAAKRRGTSSTEAITQRQQVIPLVLPIQIVQHFQVNTNNQVIRAGQQALITVQSGKMTELVKGGTQNARNDPPRVERIESS